MSATSKSMTGASAQAIVLSLLDRGDRYGYELIKEVEERSGGEVVWAPGSLYPLLHRMRSDGLVEAYWVENPGERRRKYYRLTPHGRQTLAAEKKEWLTVHNLLAQLWGLRPSLS